LKILRAVASGHNTVSAVSTNTGLKITSLPFYMRELEKYDLVRRSNGGYAIADKVLKDYLMSGQL
jgi:DNA-binding IclR family transcriptional regulator